MITYGQYESENILITEYRDKLKAEYDKFIDNKQQIREYPMMYKDDIEELRVLIRNALVWARKLINRKGEQGGFNNKEIALEVKRTCLSLSTLISRFYHPYELAERRKERNINRRATLKSTLGPDAESDLEFLYETCESIPSLKEKYDELSKRAQRNTDDTWLIDIQTFRGELAFIIKRSKLIYKKYHMNEEVTKIVHRKIVYTCRQLDIQLARYIDPITDIM